MPTNLDRFLGAWLPATSHGTWRAVAWWEGGFGVKNQITFLKVTDEKADAAHIRGLVTDFGEVFFYASTFSQRSTKTDYAEPSPCLWLDFDQADPRGVRLDLPPPTLLWETSAGNYQGLWLLDRALPQADRIALNRTLYDAYKENGADASYDASRRLRLPGTVNLKPGRNEAIVRIVASNGVYAPSEIGSPEPSRVSPEPGAPDPVSLGPRDAQRVFDAYHVSRQTRDMWSTVPTGDRSTHLSRLMARLARLGVPANELFVVAFTAKSNKFRNRPEQLWSEVVKTIEKFPPREKKNEDKPLYTLYDTKALMRIDPTIEWLVADYWPRGGCGIVYGSPGSRKSWIATHFMLSILSGKPFLGRPVEFSGPVIYHALDDALKQVARRVRNVAEYLNFDLDSTNNFIWSDTGFTFADSRWEESFRRDIKTHQPRLIVIDGLYLAGYSALDFGSTLPAMMGPLKDLRKEEPQTAFMILHHSPKGSNAENSTVRTGSAGSTFISAWGEVAWRMDGQGLNEDGLQTVYLDVDSKFGTAPPPLKLTFGNDPSVYDVDYETRELSDRAVISALREGPVDGLSGTDIATLLGRPSKAVETLLVKMEGRGLLISVGKGPKRLWQATGSSRPAEGLF